MKLKRIRKSKKDKRNRKLSKKVPLCTKHLLQPDSPFNNNEYLINVNSSPFWNDDEEDSIEIIPSSIININNDTNFENYILYERSFEVTKENSVKENNEKEKSLQLIQEIDR